MASERAVELKDWRKQTEAELDAAQRKRADAERHVAAAQERLALIDRLLALEQSDVGSPPAGPERLESNEAEDLLDASERILREAGQPMHIAELLAALRSSGVALPGRGTDANLIVRLRRADGRFIRTGRGIYGLPAFGLPEVPTTAKRKRRRRTSK